MKKSGYYPFGMMMPGRKYSAEGGYRYGFNGKENDNEVKGEGNQQDYGMRIYDPRLGRFLSVDPIAKHFPELSTYQYASNRPIDGIDLDGKEYITFHVKITKDANGKPSFSKTIAEDFRGMTAQQMAKIHDNSDFAKNFFKYFAESYGPEGRGFKWIYFNEKGEQIGEPVWQMRQNKYLNFENSGYYSGSGSITKYGPGPEGHEYDYLNNDYDFSYKPMGRADEISKEHDMIQESTIEQPQGWLEDVRTLPSDYILKYKVDQALKNKSWNSDEDRGRLENMKSFFAAVIKYKVWKSKALQGSLYDTNKPESQRKIVFGDWLPRVKEIKAWFILRISGGAASESDRNTVKPTAKKTP